MLLSIDSMKNAHHKTLAGIANRTDNPEVVLQYLVRAIKVELPYLFPFLESVAVALRPPRSEFSRSSGSADKRSIVIRARLPLDSDGDSIIAITLIAPSAVFQARSHDTKGHLSYFAEAFAQQLEAGIASLAQPEAPNSQVSTLIETLQDAVVSQALTNRFELDCELASIIRYLRHLPYVTYETRRPTQGYVFVRAKSKSGIRLFDFITEHSKQALPLADGYRVCLCVGTDGRITNLISLDHQTPLNTRLVPRWLYGLSAATAPSFRVNHRRSLFAIVVNQHGDIAVLIKGNLAAACRSGSWRIYENETNAAIIDSAIASQFRAPRKSARAKLARELMRTALDVSYARTGAILAVVPEVAVRNRKYVNAGDVIGTTGTGIRQDFLPGQVFSHFPPEVRQGLASLDGAVLISPGGKLLTFGAIIRGAPRSQRGAPHGARSRAARRISELGLVAKVSADGDIEVLSRGQRILHLSHESR
jgi:hypothetical protein